MSGGQGRLTLPERLQEIEVEELRSALKATGWVNARAARVLGITERMMGYKMKKYGIAKEGSGDEIGRLAPGQEHRAGDSE
jgi:Nif-specific regulatory protein